MPHIVACPRCSVAVAVTTPAVARLRCPVCREEFAAAVSGEEVLVSPVRREAPAATVAAVASPRAAVAPRASEIEPTVRSSSGGWLGNLVGIAGGGFLGLAAGYYLLNLFGGPQYDFLHIPLPRVAHTQPGWINPDRLEPAPPPATGLVAANGAAEPLLSPPASLTVLPADDEVDRKPAPAAEAAASGAEGMHAEPDHGAVLASAIMPVEEDAPLPGKEGPVTESPSTEVASAASQATEEATAELGPIDAPRYTMDELEQALAAAQACLGCPACNATGYVERMVTVGSREVDGQRIEEQAARRFPCEACQGRAPVHLTQESYRHLCHLAETATYVTVDEGDGRVWGRREALRQTLLRAASDQEDASSLGRLAGHWLANAEREDDGILLAGTVRDVGRQGPFHLTRVVLFGLPKEVTVASLGRSPFQPRDRVLIAGSIVDDPASRLAGYEGSQAQIVWGGLPLRLPGESP
jgi:hypothetical protein